MAEEKVTPAVEEASDAAQETAPVTPVPEAEEVKAEEAKADAEEPKVEEAKADEIKVEEEMAEAPKAEAKPKASAKKAADGDKKPAAKKKTPAKKADAEEKTAKAEKPAAKKPARKGTGATVVIAPKASQAEEKQSVGTVKVTLKRALTGCNAKQIAVAHSLGLKRPGETSIQPDNGPTNGKITKISFLLDVSRA